MAMHRVRTGTPCASTARARQSTTTTCLASGTAPRPRPVSSQIKGCSLADIACARTRARARTLAQARALALALARSFHIADSLGYAGAGDTAITTRPHAHLRMLGGGVCLVAATEPLLIGVVGGDHASKAKKTHH